MNTNGHPLQFVLLFSFQWNTPNINETRGFWDNRVETEQNIFSYCNDVKSNAVHFLVLKIKLFHSLSWESPLAISMDLSPFT